MIFSYGRAALCLSNFDTARKYLMRAAKLKPQDKDVNNELKKVNAIKLWYTLVLISVILFYL